MTRRAIRRHHRERIGIKSRHAAGAAMSVPVSASSSGASELHLDKDVDQFLVSWWRATRMGRRPNTAKK